MTQTFGKGPVVDVAVVAAGDEGDAAGGEGGEGCQGGQHVGGKRVVDEGDPVNVGDDLQPVEERGVAAGGRVQPVLVVCSRDAERLQHRSGDQRVAPVVVAE